MFCCGDIFPSSEDNTNTDQNGRLPWRTANIKHSSNEIYMDIIEEIDAVIDRNGVVVSYDLLGCIQAQAHLSGVPDLILTFKDPSRIDDCSFHPCVCSTRFEKEKILSFVPPDGNFQLMQYRVKPEGLQSDFSLPIVCTPQIVYVPSSQTQVSSSLTSSEDWSGEIIVTVCVRPINTLIYSSSKKGSLIVEDVSVTIPFPKSVKTVVDLKVSIGEVHFDEADKVAKWEIGRLDKTTQPQLTGTIVLNSNEIPDDHPPISLHWKIPLGSWSGLTISGLSLSGETYKPYKGVRNIAKSGRYQVRC